MPPAMAENRRKNGTSTSIRGGAARERTRGQGGENRLVARLESLILKIRSVSYSARAG